MAQAAGHHKEMEDLVHPEIGVALFKAGALEGVDDAAHRVEQPAGQQPAEAGAREAAQQLRQGKDAGPAHGDIQHRRHPLGAEHKEQHQHRPQQGAAPDHAQQNAAHQSRQGQQADRGIAARDQDKDHDVVQLFEQRLVFAAGGHGMVGGAVYSTGEMLRAALFLIGLKKGIKTLSSTFFLESPDKSLFTNGTVFKAISTPEFRVLPMFCQVSL